MGRDSRAAGEAARDEGLGSEVDCLRGGGEMGALMRGHDWRGTALGPPETWPQSLQTVTGLALHSKFPMFIAWGPELVFLYNDAYAPILGRKHPHALGRPFKDIWFEIWDDIRPLTERAMAGEATYRENLPLRMLRKGYEEETYFTFSYSPLSDGRGGVGGMFCACTETTAMVLAERRQAEAVVAMRESEARFRHMADHAPVMVWVTNEVGSCTYLSRSWYDFTGQTEEQGLGFGWIDAVHPEDLPHAREKFLAAAVRREPFRLDYRLRKADGTYRWTIDAASPRLGEDGAFLGFVGSVLDITERKQAEEHRELLINELNHRVKNTLATVQSIATQSLRNAPGLEDAQAAFEGRLLALSRVHDVLTRENWDAASLREIASRAIEPYQSHGEQRFRLDGPDIRLRPGIALALAMALQELVTNAVKYGALSDRKGEIHITWHLSEGRTHLDLQWLERDGPPVVAPLRRGFGTRLIERSLAVELNGLARIDFAPGGVVCTLRVPIHS